MDQAISLVASISAALTSTPCSLAADAVNARIVRVFGTAKAHLSFGTPTTDDLPIGANWGALIAVPPGATLAAIKATGETDGTIWFSTIKRV